MPLLQCCTPIPTQPTATLAAEPAAAITPNCDAPSAAEPTTPGPADPPTSLAAEPAAAVAPNCIATSTAEPAAAFLVYSQPTFRLPSASPRAAASDSRVMLLPVKPNHRLPG